jgi:prepilin-type N-terminal cleavage/methylation domain-containing protein
MKRCIPRLLECHRGLTLLELVMVLFVLSLMLALSFPLFTSLAGRFKVGSARDVFINTYARTRAAAMQFGRDARLRIDAGNDRFWVEVDTGVPPALATDTLGPVVDVARDYGGVTMFSAKQKLCFDARGLTYSGSDGCETHDAVITFSRLSRTDTVQLSLGGTVVRRF